MGWASSGVHRLVANGPWRQPRIQTRWGGDGPWEAEMIIFHPSPFCKPFFPPHPHPWHPPLPLLCCSPPYRGHHITIQTHLGSPKNPGWVLWVLPWAWGQGQLGWRWLGDECPLPKLGKAAG